jgi:hypothetical protein
MAKPKTPIPQRGVQIHRGSQRLSHMTRKDGHPIPLQRVQTVVVDGQHTIRYGLDMGTAPVPQRRFAADVCWVDLKRGELRIDFAQEAVGSNSYENALRVKLSLLATQNLLEVFDGANGNPSIVAIAQNVGSNRETLEPLAGEVRHQAGLVANFTTIGISGSETCVDFYHASAFAMNEAQRRGELELEPVVRIDLRTPLFVAMMEQIRRVAGQQSDDLKGSI